MKYVLTPESDALEAFPARPCNIYVASRYIVHCEITLFREERALIRQFFFREHKGNARAHRDDRTSMYDLANPF